MGKGIRSGAFLSMGIFRLLSIPCPILLRGEFFGPTFWSKKFKALTEVYLIPKKMQSSSECQNTVGRDFFSTASPVFCCFPTVSSMCSCHEHAQKSGSTPAHQ